MESIDRLSSLLERFRVRAHLFHSGTLCGLTAFDARPGRAFLHVLKRGDMVVSHDRGSGAQHQIALREPTLLFYPRSLRHTFENPPDNPADLVCATLDFESGSAHPLAAALPPVIVLPLSRVDGLGQTLDLLFAEAERVRCGQRLVADRLFEVLLLQLMRWMLDHPQEVGLQSGLLSGLSHPRLARVLTAVHEHPENPWSLKTMAESAGMSRSAFAATFHDVVGSTPAAYLQSWRICIAQSLLRSGLSIKSAAHQLGFSSAAALSRSFAQVVGVSPRAWLQAPA
jgi:AraC-like DNA-binding protein